MKNEVIEALNVRPGGFYIDATYGAGGHSIAILEKNAAVLALDRDYKSLEIAKEMKASFEGRFILRHDSFVNLAQHWQVNVKPMLVDGIIADLGFSSDQVDDPDRGFSFSKDGPLDMRYDTRQDWCAADWINSANAEEMASVFWKYSQEKNAHIIARAIEKARQTKRISSTFDLVDIINRHNRHDHKHSATRVFQAIRIHVNDELAALHEILVNAKKLLKHYGRLVIITFHSGEDAIVKRHFDNEANFLLYPSTEEIEKNPRARSAKLRWMIKIDKE
jgi:16S rRNA (cytosine1402-N4)-methyltransferase